MLQRQVASQQEAASATLTKAVIRAARLLGISQQLLARVLGLSTATVSRMMSGQYFLRDGKEWEFAVLFVRIFRSLDALLGNADAARQWLNGDNLALAGKPIDLIQTTEGMVRVLHYMDAHRGRI